MCIIFVATSSIMDTTVATETATNNDKVVKDDSRR